MEGLGGKKKSGFQTKASQRQWPVLYLLFFFKSKSDNEDKEMSGFLPIGYAD